MAKAEGYYFTDPPPEPVTCEFCGKTLYHYGGVLPIAGTKHIFTWFKEPERCDCPQAQEHWRRVEEEKKKAEEEESRRRQQAIIQSRISKLIKDSGLRGRFQTRTFEKFIPDEKNARALQAAKRYADHFNLMLPGKDEYGNVTEPARQRNGLFIVGSYGTGKTHLAAAIANQLIHKNHTPVICMTMIDLLARIKQTFDRSDNATEAEIMKIYEDVPLLIIDDLGSEQPTEWGTTKIFSILNARYEAYMPTIITTNYTVQDLTRRLTPPDGDSRNAEKSIDRLCQVCEAIEMFWDSWRTR